MIAYKKSLGRVFLEPPRPNYKLVFIVDVVIHCLLNHLKIAHFWVKTSNCGEYFLRPTYKIYLHWFSFYKKYCCRKKVASFHFVHCVRLHGPRACASNFNRSVTWSKWIKTPQSPLKHYISFPRIHSLPP